MKTALIAKVTALSSTRNTVHYSGVPPIDGDGPYYSQKMSPASMLVIEENDSGFFLYRYSSDRKIVGDTWHKTIEEAKEQAKFEFGECVSKWKEVPSDIQDALELGSDL